METRKAMFRNKGDGVRRSNVHLSRTYRKKTGAETALEQVTADKVPQIKRSRIPVNPKQD